MTIDEVPAEKPRNGKGEYTRTVTGAERRREALKHLRDHKGYQQIADAMGISLSYAHQLVKEGLAEIPRDAAIEVRDMVAERTAASQQRLMDMREQIIESLGRDHVTVSQGRVVYLESGEPVEDHDYLLRAIDRLQRIEDSLGKNEDRLINLLGLRVPPTTNISGHVTYTIEGLDDAEA